MHYGIGETEAHQSIMQAYILLGDLIRACDQASSSVLSEECMIDDSIRNLTNDHSSF